MKKSYNTKQKDCILSAIQKMGDNHFTAEQILESLKAEKLSIGVSTVYRHLDKLCAEGELQRLATLSDKGACYQAKNCTQKHFHLKCVKCGGLEHLSCEKLTMISQHVEREHDFVIDSSKTVFYGLCRNCQ